MRSTGITTAAWIWLSALGALAVSLVWLLWPQRMPVETATIDRGEVRREIREDGQARIHDVYAVTAPVSGLLQRVDLRPGDAVSAGDVVATILPPAPALLDARSEREAVAAVTAARSALSAAEADERLASVEAERTSALFSKGFASKAAHDRAGAVHAGAQAAVGERMAELARARASLAQSRPGQKKIVIRSPAAGLVLQVLQESETSVTPGMQLMEIGDPATLEIVADYLSQDAADMTEGACALIETAGRPAATARVRTIEPFARTKLSALGVEEQRVNVVLDPAPDFVRSARLGHGYKVDVRVIVFRQDNALRVPADAIFRTSDGGWGVFRFENGHARLTPVQIGQGDDRFRLVESGLAEGDRVILFPGNALKDGDGVRSMT